MRAGRRSPVIPALALNRRGLAGGWPSIVAIVALAAGSATSSSAANSDCSVASGTDSVRDAVTCAALSGRSPLKAEASDALVASRVGKAAHDILGPYSDLADRIASSMYEAVLPSSRSGTLHWPILVLTIVIAIGFFFARRGRGAKDADGRERPCGLREYLLPSRLYRHPSARVDIGLYLIDRALMPVWFFLGLGALAPLVEQLTIGAALAALGPSPRLQATVPWQVIHGLSMLLVADAVFFFTHLFGHRTRIGWAFHKVHHSAEVLTPLTRYREHFFEGFLYAATSAAGLGVCGGMYAYVFDGGITEITIMNLGIFAFIYALNGNFRHYHVSFRYPRWLERWLQSPGMHHAHHSTLAKHWDKNLGLVTSVWDRLFGTLYIGERDEETPWGLPPAEQVNYTTLRQNLIGPFREVLAILFPRRRVDG